MGKPRDTKVAILPSTTRKGTTLSTSAALDSPSVIDKLVSPPHASHAGTSAESENSHNIDNISAVLDDSGSLGSFLDATIARSRQIENTETPNATTPVNSPELDYSSDDPDEDYVELNDDFIEKCNATTDARKIKKLLAEHAVRYKLSPDPKFATSPINIKDKDYDFSLDLSHIAIVEKTPFCGTEKESAVEHMTELSTLSSLFSDDVKMRTYFVAKIFPFSLKDDAKTWYNSLPPNSIKSPKELLDVFFRKYFPASAQHIALQRIYNFDQGDEEKLPEAWARFCSLIRARPDHDLEKHDLLDIFYSGLTIESRAYLDSCAGCVFRKRTPDDAEELLAKIGRNHDDWTMPEPTPTPILKKRGMIKLNDEDMREAKKSLKEKGIKSEDVKNLPPIEDICEIIPPSSMIEDPLYPEGHPKRIEQDSQRIEPSAPSKKKKKKKHKNVVESSEPVNDPNSISISDAETESGNEHDKDNDKNDASDKEDVEEEPEKHAKNKKYTKEDFIAEKHEGRKFWCMEHEFIYKDIYEPMKNLRPMQAIDVDLLAVNNHFEDAIWVAGRMGLKDIMKIQCDYSPELVKQFFATLAIQKDEDRTMEWMTGSTHCRATLRRFAGILGVPAGGGRRLHGPQRADKNALFDLYTSARKVGSSKGLLPIYSQLLRFFRATISPSGGNNDALRGTLVDLMHLSFRCARDVDEERNYTIDVMDFIFMRSIRRTMRPAESVLRLSILRRLFCTSSVVSKDPRLSLQFTQVTVGGILHRNPSKEIFSELDEINAQHLIIQRSFQNTREAPEGVHRATDARLARPEGVAPP
ncbi:hypothetical protein QYE76_071037 [Lolium multiflorum]|uniref:Retrotransposon gag domain-containing protein n=1 Tax=Lolium multiflorum TaxID=4521 RepID=A0AAD8SLB2_LOLMU|nr:hypothetical protein QYE76_071037 [Lolium multiflorum]